MLVPMPWANLAQDEAPPILTPAMGAASQVRAMSPKPPTRRLPRFTWTRVAQQANGVRLGRSESLREAELSMDFQMTASGQGLVVCVNTVFHDALRTPRELLLSCWGGRHPCRQRNKHSPSPPLSCKGPALAGTQQTGTKHTTWLFSKLNRQQERWELTAPLGSSQSGLIIKSEFSPHRSVSLQREILSVGKGPVVEPEPPPPAPRVSIRLQPPRLQVLRSNSVVLLNPPSVHRDQTLGVGECAQPASAGDAGGLPRTLPARAGPWKEP